MSDFPTDQDPETEQTASFEQWLQHVSEEADVSPGEVLEQLVSAYWTLNEIFGLVEQTGNTSPLFGANRRSRDQSGESVPSTQTFDQFFGHQHAETGPERSEESPPTLSVEETEAIEAQLSALESRLASFESDTEAESESMADATVALSKRIEAVHAESAAERETLRAYVGAEFGNTREVLLRLIDRLDEHDAAIDSLGERIEAEAIRDTAQTRLAEIARQANRNKITKARCEACETSVRIGLLMDPVCPECERPFDRLEPYTGRWPFGSDTLCVDDASERERDTSESIARSGPVLPELDPEEASL
ncbi:hypothetical protein [Halobellus captivus]|uniref:hypothetical protein n=1 Tax=Halobellus captivus TaxID=2592614 RepID=UPI0011A619BC|nr:hypothetical protein [Halobellus captivus]